MELTLSSQSIKLTQLKAGNENLMFSFPAFLIANFS